MVPEELTVALPCLGPAAMLTVSPTIGSSTGRSLASTSTVRVVSSATSALSSVAFGGTFVPFSGGVGTTGRAGGSGGGQASTVRLPLKLPLAASTKDSMRLRSDESGLVVKFGSL